MNDWMCPRLTWDDARRPDRGKVLGADDLAKIPKFFRYLSENGDSIAPRTWPGVDPKGAYFVRGSGHNKFGAYTEDADEYREVVDRIARKIANAANSLPAPEIVRTDQARQRATDGAPVGIITIGSNRGAVLEALDRLRERGIALDYLRVRSFPFGSQVVDFVRAHDRCIVIEQNRDGQLRSLLILETGVAGDRLLSLREYGGLPFGADHVITGIERLLAGVTAGGTV
jgi:2-oxoglutarate ferredoxin oxidoreductase subunit alpha